jgi:type II secretory pathway pseudopilin PulG
MALGLATASLALLLIGWIGARVLRPLAQATKQQMTRTQSQKNVERILKAMQEYRTAHGHLPPAYSVDEQGRPLHSWRVLILPYLGPEEKALAQQIRFNEPFDSPHNAMFANRVPAVYCSPADQPFAPGDCSYLVLTGEAFAFNRDRTIDYPAILDPRESTILLTEFLGSGINWMSPRDITADQLSRGLTNPGLWSTPPYGEDLLLVGTSDNRARWLPGVTSVDVIRTMATIAGGESTPPPFTQSN